MSNNKRYYSELSQLSTLKDYYEHLLPSLKRDDCKQECMQMINALNERIWRLSEMDNCEIKERQIVDISNRPDITSLKNKPFLLKNLYKMELMRIDHIIQNMEGNYNKDIKLVAFKDDRPATIEELKERKVELKNEIKELDKVLKGEV